MQDGCPPFKRSARGGEEVVRCLDPGRCDKGGAAFPKQGGASSTWDKRVYWQATQLPGQRLHGMGAKFRTPNVSEDSDKLFSSAIRGVWWFP